MIRIYYFAILAILLTGIIVPWRDSPYRNRTEADRISELCIIKVEAATIQKLVNTTLSRHPYSHQRLVTAILIVEASNRPWLRRHIEYWIVKNWAKAGILRTQLMRRTLGLGQVSIKNASDFFMLHKDLTRDQHLEEITELLTDDVVNVIIVSEILLQIEDEMGITDSTADEVRIIANRYNGTIDMSKHALYGDVVAAIWARSTN